MARSDYAHWNEEQDSMWWAEEGQFEGREEFDDYDPDDYLPAYDDDDEDGDAFDEPKPRRVNAFGPLSLDAPELPGDHFLEMNYEDRYTESEG
jgi:hypothetical protein